MPIAGSKVPMLHVFGVGVGVPDFFKWRVDECFDGDFRDVLSSWMAVCTSSIAVSRENGVSCRSSSEASSNLPPPRNRGSTWSNCLPRKKPKSTRAGSARIKMTGRSLRYIKLPHLICSLKPLACATTTSRNASTASFCQPFWHATHSSGVVAEFRIIFTTHRPH
jgi:hypothetical protein